MSLLISIFELTICTTGLFFGLGLAGTEEVAPLLDPPPLSISVLARKSLKLTLQALLSFQTWYSANASPETVARFGNAGEAVQHIKGDFLVVSVYSAV